MDVLCCWKHLVEVSFPAVLEVEAVMAAECNIASLQQVKCATVRVSSNMSPFVFFHPISLCQYRLSLVEVCVVVESSGREPRRPGPDRQCSRFCSSLDTLLENAV